MPEADPGALTEAQAALQALAPGDAAGWHRRFGADYALFARAVVARNAPPPGLEMLVSVVGAAFWPAVLVAAWARPRRLLLLRRERPLVLEGVPSLVEAMVSVTGLSLDAIEQQWVDGAGEEAIYTEVRDVLARGDLRPAGVGIDVSGADALGAAAGALVAEACGARLVLLEGGAMGGGRAGEERVRLLSSPGARWGAQSVRRVRDAFEGGRYAEAATLARALGERLESPREVLALAHLAEGYGAWHRFDFAGAVAPLEAFLRDVADHAGDAGWAWARSIEARVRVNLEALAGLCALPAEPASLEAGLPAVLNHLAATHRALAQADLDDALLLLHGTLERWVDLVLRTCHGIDSNATGPIDLPEGAARERFDGLGEALFGRPVRGVLHGPLLFLRAVQVLGALDPGRLDLSDASWIRGLAHMRNALAHALVPTHPAPAKVRSKLARIEAFLGRQPELSDLEARLSAYAFPALALP